jgi:alpha-glucosidase
MKFISIWIILFTIFLFLNGIAEKTVQSPDGRLSLIFDEISYNEEEWQGNWLSYSVKFDGKTIVRFSPMALILKEQPEIGRSLQFKNVIYHEIDTDSEILLGKSKILHNHCHEIRISLQETGPINRRFTLIGRAYNDGVAFRLHLPFQASLKDVTVAEERIDFPLTIRYSLHAALKAFSNTLRKQL